MTELIYHFVLWYILTGIAVATIAFWKTKKISRMLKDKERHHKVIFLIGLFIFCVITWIYIFVASLPKKWIER